MSMRSSRSIMIHLAANPEAVEPTQWKTQYTSKVARYVLRPTNSKDIPVAACHATSQPHAQQVTEPIVTGYQQ
jgi:hypothetical protein